ncbi:MAG: anti-sigma factor [Planctomycetes bacterium]|nr:anti-sigma factor [Planctomycetota bacterium]
MSDNAMNAPISADAQRLLDLLADRATGALGPAEAAELDSLLRRVPQLTDADGRTITPDYFEASAGAAMFALGPQPQPLPSQVRERLLARGREIAREASRQVAPDSSSPAPAPSKPAGPSVLAKLGMLGWLAAAAAVILSVINIYNAQPRPAYRAYRDMLASGVQSVAFAPQGRFKDQNIRGDIVWDKTTKTGYARISNIAALDPKQQQLQLWVIDKDRPAGPQTPIDAGYFSLDSAYLDPVTKDYIVPITARLQVFNEQAIGLTIEHTGGSVTPTMENLVAVAPLK